MSYTIQQLNIYPIKGLAGISVKSAKALQRGFENDRRYMLVDKNGKFISQREVAKMALMIPSIVNRGIHVTSGDDELTINFQELGKKLEVQVWQDQFDAYHINTKYDKWFSDRLGTHCRLVKMNKITRRERKLNDSNKTFEVSFADGYPYHILGAESLAFLNERLEDKIPIDRFRANIILNTNKAHCEDDLEKFHLGEAIFKVTKPCVRCMVTTIDQMTGLKTKEPLKTLSQYRKVGNNIHFGTNAICLQEGVVSIGQKIKS